MSAIRALILSLALGGCVSPRVAALETRLAQAEADILALQSRSAASPSAPATDEARETAAEAVFRAASTAVEELRYEEARSGLEQLARDYAGTRADTRASRLRTELAVVGAPAGVLQVDHWLQGSGSFDGPGVTLVVFAEEWCPHCKREVPKMQELSVRYAGRVQVIGLTKLTRSSTEEKMRAFLGADGVTFPFAVETGEMSERFSVSGIPAGVMIRDGKVVWRGHPARLTDQAMETLLAKP